MKGLAMLPGMSYELSVVPLPFPFFCSYMNSTDVKPLTRLNFWRFPFLYRIQIVCKTKHIDIFLRIKAVSHTTSQMFRGETHSQNILLAIMRHSLDISFLYGMYINNNKDSLDYCALVYFRTFGYWRWFERWLNHCALQICTLLYPI